MSLTIQVDDDWICMLGWTTPFKIHNNVTDILVHPVVLYVATEGDLVADEDVDGIALYARLLLFLLISAEGQSCGSSVFSRSVGVWGWLFLYGSHQAAVIIYLEGRKVSDEDVTSSVTVGQRWGGGRGYEDVKEPQQREKEADLGQQSHLSWPADLHDLQWPAAHTAAVKYPWTPTLLQDKRGKRRKKSGMELLKNKDQ